MSNNIYKIGDAVFVHLFIVFIKVNFNFCWSFFDHNVQRFRVSWAINTASLVINIHQCSNLGRNLHSVMMMMLNFSCLSFHPPHGHHWNKKNVSSQLFIVFLTTYTDITMGFQCRQYWTKHSRCSIYVHMLDIFTI
jgi:hypothetical protein